jgi:hypothetical protein
MASPLGVVVSQKHDSSLDTQVAPDDPFLAAGDLTSFVQHAVCAMSMQ